MVQQINNINESSPRSNWNERVVSESSAVNLHLAGPHRDRCLDSKSFLQNSVDVFELANLLLGGHLISVRRENTVNFILRLSLDLGVLRE
jgi:hypothetical protein